MDTTQLRGHSRTAPCFHNNSATTLEQVLDGYQAFSLCRADGRAAEKAMAASSTSMTSMSYTSCGSCKAGTPDKLGDAWGLLAIVLAFGLALAQVLDLPLSAKGQGVPAN